jgi:acyl dehydratase
MFQVKPTDPKAPRGFPEPPIPDMPFPPNVTGAVDGGGEWEFYKPLKVGDVITTRTKLVNIYARKGRLGKMYFYVMETSIVNQHNEDVGKGTGTLILYG